MILPEYRAQVNLLLQILPHINKEDCFALKGGTAINLFIRELPRLSVDIDLTYLYFDERAVALAQISEALQRIKNRIDLSIPNSTTRLLSQDTLKESKMVCRVEGVQVKIEVNTTMRGHLFPTKKMDVSNAV